MNAKNNQLVGPALFFTFVMLGIGFIVLAKAVFLLSPWLALGVPVLIMLSYALIVHLPALRLRDDQTGDNLYYMGFLFTLASLGVALYQFSSAGSAEQIVQAFGIAIASTIAGIALRVLFAQMRHDPIEVERDARIELAEAARRVRRELDATVIELSNFRRHTTQALNDGYKEVQAKVDEISTGLMKSIGDTVEQTRSPLISASKASSDLLGTMGATTASKLNTFAETMTASLDKSAVALALENDRLSHSVAAMSKTLDDMAKKLHAMQMPEQVIEVKLEPILRPIVRGASDFAKSAERAATVNLQHLEKAEAIQSSLAELAKNLQDVSARLSQNEKVQIDLFEALGNLSKTLSDGFGTMSSGTNLANSNMETLVVALQGANHTVAMEISSLCRELRELRSLPSATVISAGPQANELSR